MKFNVFSNLIFSYAAITNFEMFTNWVKGFLILTELSTKWDQMTYVEGFRYNIKNIEGKSINKHWVSSAFISAVETSLDTKNDEKIRQHFWP